MLIILTKQTKSQKPKQVGEIIRAEIPDKEKESELYKIITRHNMHGPCGKLRPNSPCMSDNECSKSVPKAYVEEPK